MEQPHLYKVMQGKFNYKAHFISLDNKHEKQSRKNNDHTKTQNVKTD